MEVSYACRYIKNDLCSSYERADGKYDNGRTH